MAAQAIIFAKGISILVARSVPPKAITTRPAAMFVTKSGARLFATRVEANMTHVKATKKQNKR